MHEKIKNIEKNLVLNKTKKEFLEKRYKKTIKRILEIEKFITDEIKQTRKQIIEYQKQWYKVAIICLTGDLMHPAHISYIKTAIEKIKQKFNLTDKNIKVIIWLEDEKRTLKRKWKLPILSNQERKYQRLHLKFVDNVFIWNIDLDHYPSDLMLYLKPDFRISHQEYFDFWKYLRVSRKLKYGTKWKTKAIIVKFDDPDKLLPEWNIRKKRNLSTSNIVKRILDKQGDYIIKKFPDKIIELFNKITLNSLKKTS